MAISRLVVLRSVIFCRAISSNWVLVICPTFSRLGSLAPLATWAICLSSTDAGGVLVTNVKERSAKTVISTGMMVPSWPAVRAL